MDDDSRFSLASLQTIFERSWADSIKLRNRLGFPTVVTVPFMILYHSSCHLQYPTQSLQYLTVVLPFLQYPLSVTVVSVTASSLACSTRTVATVVIVWLTVLLFRLTLHMLGLSFRYKNAPFSFVVVTVPCSLQYPFFVQYTIKRKFAPVTAK